MPLGHLVVIGAPLGSVMGTHFHRLVLAAMVLVINTAALIGAYIVIRPLTTTLIIISVSIIVGGVLFFGLVALVGSKSLHHIEANQVIKRMKEFEAASVRSIGVASHVEKGQHNGVIHHIDINGNSENASVSVHL